MTALLLIATLVLTSFVPLTLGDAGAQTRFVLSSESRVWIEGRTPVSTFRCDAERFDGAGMLDGTAVSGALHVDVASFACGRQRMDADLFETLRGAQHPTILFRLDTASATAAGDTLGLHGAGWLTLAGTERYVAVSGFTTRRADGTFRAVGRLPLRLTDFGLDPPTALGGLIRVRDDITVFFDLVVASYPTYSTK